MDYFSNSKLFSAGDDADVEAGGAGGGDGGGGDSATTGAVREYPSSTLLLHGVC